MKPFVPSKNNVLKAIDTWYLTVPLHDNDGKRYHAGLVETIRNHVLSVFDGETETRTTGSWKRDQRVCQDDSFRIEIDVYVEDHDKAEAYMAKAKRDLKDFLKQAKIYVTVSRARFELLLPDEFCTELGLNPPALDLPPAKDLNQIKIDLYRTLAGPPS